MQTMQMQFKKNGRVTLTDGAEVGRLDRVVLDVQTKEVTHVVIRKGFLFTEDKVVPAAWIGSATPEGVVLLADPSEMDTLPPFEETEYVPAAAEDRPQAVDEAMPLYWYPAGIGLGGALVPAPPPTFVRHTELNIPPGTVALREGARVIASNGEPVGQVEVVLTEAGTDRAIGLIISKGLLLKEQRRVPITWVSRLDEDEIHLAVSPHQLEALAPSSN